MKNNEYNIVKVTNEGKNYQTEYTTAQNVEYSFQPENKTTIKDELNDNSTVNDKVENNVSKATKEKEKKQERKETETVDNSSLASSSSASATSSVASSSSAIGGIGGVVAAASASIVAVGTIVGINVLGPQIETELATFLTSEVTTNSVDFSFSMPSRLLRYEESGDEPVGEKMVVATIEDGEGYSYEDYLIEYDEYDENTYIYSHRFTSLTPDTGYALTISIKEENPTVEESTYLQLARRTFKTEAIAQAVIFESIEATQTDVEFIFLANKDACGYDPETQRMPQIKAEIHGSDDHYDDMWIQDLREYDEINLSGTGNFSGLTASTNYTITLSVSMEQEFKQIGSTSFTTEAKPDSGFGFDTVTPKETSVDYRIYVNADYIGFVEGETQPDVIAKAYIDGEVVTQQQVDSFFSYGKLAVAFKTLDGLTAETTYRLVISYNHDGIEEVLGETTFTTTEASQTFYFAEDEFFIIGDNYIQPMFYIKTSEVEQTDPTNIDAIISGGMGYTYTYHLGLDEIQTALEDGYSFAKPAFNNLDPNVTYKISVINNITQTEYGQISKTTTGPETGFIIDSLVVDTTSVTTDFTVSTSYTTATTNLYVRAIDENGTEVGTAGCDVKSMGQDTNTFTATLTGLTPDTNYTLGYYCLNPESSAAPDVLLGMRDFTTDQAASPHFYSATIDDQASFYNHEFNLTLNYVDDPSNPQYDDLYIQCYADTVSSEYRDGNKLGDPISLSSTTQEQTVTIPSDFSYNEPAYAFDLSSVESYDILAGSEVVFSDNITFVDSDPQGTVSRINSDYLVTIDNSDPDNVEAYMPIQIDYTDDYHNLKSFWVIFSVEGQPEGSEITTNASISETGNYQYAIIRDSNVIQAIQDGRTFKIDICKQDDQSNPLYTETGVEIKAADINHFYYGSIDDKSYDQSDTELRFYDLVYVYGDSQASNGPELVFEFEGTEYVYLINIPSYPSQAATVDLMNPRSGPYTSYNDLASTMGGKSFNVYIRYYPSAGTSEQNLPIATSLSLTFM